MPTAPQPDLAERLQRHDLPFDDGHVAWRHLGDGPPLVLMHGGHGAWLHWARNIDALARHFGVWVVDLPGYGDSSVPSAPTLESLLDATQPTLDALLGARTPIALAGFSFGGLVAAQLAARRGAVRALGLLGPAGHGGPRRPQGELRSWREAWAQRDDTALREVMRHNLQLHMCWPVRPTKRRWPSIRRPACARVFTARASRARVGSPTRCAGLNARCCCSGANTT
jgi:pimeloyl-ACP methyl ester carboxylesterase